MRKIIIRLLSVTLCSFIAAQSVFAGGLLPPEHPHKHSGFYIGGQLGLGRADYGDLNKNTVQATFPSSSTRQDGLAANANIGYQISRYFAIEADYFYLPTNKYSGSIFGTTTTVRERTFAFAAMGKGIVPVTPEFSIYGKAGAAYVNSQMTSNVIGSPRFTTERVRPAYGIGASFRVPGSELSADLGWTQIYGISTSATDTHVQSPMINMIGVGLTYHIG